MRVVAAIVLMLLAGCSGATSSVQIAPTTAATATTSAPTKATVPPPGSVKADGGCGASQAYRGGSLPSWATVNAPGFLPYVVASPGTAVGYLFTDPLSAGPSGSNKILWYVWTAREGALVAVGRPLGASGATATFSRAADSGPGEIYPTGPTVPSAGCWHFTLTWRGGGTSNQADVDVMFT